MTSDDLPMEAPRPSAIGAADRALEETGRHVFQRAGAERWIALGFLAFLDQCGRPGAVARVHSAVALGDSGSGGDDLEPVLAWLGHHPLLAATMAGCAVALGIAMAAVVLWINSRGTFVYLEAVATGRAEVARPWRAHAARAGSYFAWRLGLALATFFVALALLVPAAWSVVTLTRGGSGGAAVALPLLVGCGFLAVAFLMAIALVGVALRDFAAPIQWYADVSCAEALRRLRRHVARYPLLFATYFLLKLAFEVAVVVATVLVCCFTCCGGLLPVVYQTLLQPLFYFERRWSLEILHGLGYAPPAEPAAP